MRVSVVVVAIALGSAGVASPMQQIPDQRGVAAATASARGMPDGRRWTTENLNVDTEPSFCYENAEANCRRYGRLYTWDSAQRACRALGSGWRLPTDEEWRQLASHYGGVRGDSDDAGHAAYEALGAGGRSGFHALLGGGRDADGLYARLDAHGLYWTASATGPDRAWLYNFGKGGRALSRHEGGEKQSAYSVRCVNGE